MISVNWLLLLSYYSHPDKFPGSYVYYRNNTLSVFSSIHIFLSKPIMHLLIDILSVLSFATNLYTLSLTASGFSVLFKKVILATSYCTCTRTTSLLDVCKTFFFNFLQINLQSIWNLFFVHGVRCKWIADCARANY